MKWIAALAVLCSGLAAPASAEVLSSSAAGFSTRNVVTVAAAPRDVWAKLVQPALYWNPEHSWSGDAKNLKLDPRAGGCFCETLPVSGGSVQHMQVIYADPATQLRMARWGHCSRKR